MARDICIAGCYIPPYQSSVSRTDDHYSILTEELILNSGRGDVIICGSRIGCKQETHCIKFDNLEDSQSHTDINTNDETICILKRYSEDKISNVYGSLLLDLINSSNMCIMNGKVVGDLDGKYTCHEYNGSSTVDYFIVQVN